MASGFTMKLDMSGIMHGLDQLNGPIKESLGRRMLVEAGVELRDEAKRWVPTSVGPYNPNSRGSHEAGTLRNAMYLAYDKEESNENFIKYNVSWSNAKAWWGKLVEFGYFRRYKVYYNAKIGAFTTVKEVPLKEPEFVPAKPFLRPAYDIVAGPVALRLMADRGRRELPILLAEMKK